MKIALVSIIKNEAHDILYWLSWHARLGVNSFILFDDDSSDGTRDLISTASLYRDIRLYHVRDDAVSPPGTGEPGKSAILHQDALAETREDFDWIGLLSPGDYLQLHHHASLPDFLATISDDVSAIALPLQSNGRHEQEEQPVRCFIRPEKWQPAEAGAQHEAKACLQKIEGESPFSIWPPPPGLQISPADGQPATLTPFSPALHLLDMSGGRTGAAETMASLGCITKTGILTMVEALKQAKPIPPRLALPLVRQTSSHFHIHSLRSEAGEMISIRDGFAHIQPTGETAPSLMMLQSPHFPSHGFLFAWGENNRFLPFSIPGDQHSGCLLPYDVLPVTGRSSFALRMRAGLAGCGRQEFLSCPPSRPLTANAGLPDNDAFFTITAQPHTPSGTSWLGIPVFQLAEAVFQQPGPVTLQGIVQLLHVDPHAAIWLLPFMATYLPRHEQLELQGFLGPFAQFTL